jgi:hypothetical protein
MIHIAFEALAQRVENVDPLIVAGFDAGLAGELNSLFRGSMGRNHGVPEWFERALAGPARWAALGAALSPAVTNQAAADVAVAALGPEDAPLIETVVIQHGHAGHGPLSHAILQHPNDVVRGEASLWFGLDATDYAAQLPDEWFGVWSEAFAVAPLQSSRANNHRLGEVLSRLVDRDPGLAERWVTRQIELDPSRVILDLPDQARTSLPRLPTDHRNRLIRLLQGEWRNSALLSVLLGDDIDWLVTLLDEGVVGTDEVILTLNHGDHEIPARIARLMRLAPILIPRGVDPQELASAADLGSWMGERSAHHEAIRAAFEGAPSSSDDAAAAVRAAGIEIYARARDKALGEEHERRITGDL